MERGEHLAEGIHERLVTRRLVRALAARPDLVGELTSIDEADLPHTLSRHLTASLERALKDTREPERQVNLVAALLKLVQELDETPEVPPQMLKSVVTPTVFGAPVRSTTHPSTPLSEAALLTNAPGEPQLGSELRKELLTADGVDVIMAFVKWHGLRVLEAELALIRERGVPFRIITTTYLGGSERQALDRLVREYGAQVRIQYEARRTRLHAKAWHLRRDSGFDTAFVGSSNLSKSALLDGVEWNVRLSKVATPALLAKFAATFETYWNSDHFEPYDPDIDRDRLDDALRLAAGGGGAPRDAGLVLSGLQVRPYPYQQAILDALEAERELHDRHRNLVVAATGTGKTVIAALDYQRLARKWTHDSGRSERPKLLFIAHRKEILTQSLRTYREVLADAGFGELYVGGARPERWQHVFASVQSLTAYDIRAIPADAFDVVVMDEFHHAEARTYRRILEHLAPRELLGLTATPERGDGTDVRAMFGGRTAADLRLWDAIEADLLSPFHYFGVADGTDLTRVAWRAGRYDEAQLENVFTGNDARVRLILEQIRHKITDPFGMRALGFCVSVAHAEYMAEKFRSAGLSARAVTGETAPQVRQEAIAALRDGSVQTLFAVDVFNEGLDIPEVDTVLFLRPTDSPTIFLQQLGRGLRITPDKAVLTVLDFVGAHRREFKLAERYRAMTGTPRRRLVHEIERGFPTLPSGCQVVLDRQTQDAALESVKSHLSVRRAHLVNALRAHPTDALTEFLVRAGVELSDVIRADRSFTTLRREAGLLPGGPSPMETTLAKRVRALVHVDDPLRARVYRRLLDPAAELTLDGMSVAERRLATMLYFSLFPSGKHSSIEVGLGEVRRELSVAGEIAEVTELGLDQTRHVPTALGGALEGIPLFVHARYQREEVLSALGYASLERRPSSFMAGVVRVDGPHGDIDAFFVTLKKSEAEYSPTTMYADYPISPTLFHWESQSTTSVASPTGQRYIRGSGEKLLFVRRGRNNDFGTAPYVFLGPVDHVSHQGERPIAITWRLRTPMPADLFAESAVAV
jgi:superfamily II DNA or RNA helicase/HKD family nuclease